MPGTRTIATLFGAVLAAAGPNAPAVAQQVELAVEFSTGDLMRACAAEGGPEGRSAAFCEGFILGTGLLYLELRRAGVIDAWACAEPVPTLRQIRQDFVAWAQDNPEQMGVAAIDGFWQAMAETYPCGTP